MSVRRCEFFHENALIMLSWLCMMIKDVNEMTYDDLFLADILCGTSL